MINKSTVAKALLNKAESVASDNNIDFIADGEGYDPIVNTEYMEEYVLWGDDKTLGMDSDSGDIQRGIYQLNIYVPKTTTGNKWRGLDIASLVQTEFKKALVIVNEPLTTLIETSISPMMQNDTHTYHAVSVRFSAVG